MTEASYDRLSAFDATFLAIEDENVHMHVGAVVVVDAAPLTAPDGRVDLERVRGALHGALAATPRFRQKLTRIPLLGHPVWVDDPRFNVDYHLRHTALPAPGGERSLKRLAGRILSQQLDRGKPLWELWVVEGVEAGRLALIAKAHHCMVDGVAGLDLLTAMMRLDPEPDPPPASAWTPRPAPPPGRLLRDEVARRATYPFTLARQGIGLARDPDRRLEPVRRVGRGLIEVLTAGFAKASMTPLNAEVGPYRRFDWTSIPLADVAVVRQRFGGTVNDVVLATAAGALGGFFRARGEPVDEWDFRAQVPMSIRSPDQRGVPGNQVVILFAPLPIAESDPARRLERVIDATARVKTSDQRVGVEALTGFSDGMWPELLVLFGRVAVLQRAFNVVITNIPGPTTPVFLLDAAVERIFPLVPLAQGQTLGIALFSYDGALHWGFHADWDAVPDLHELVERVDTAFAELLGAARATRRQRSTRSASGPVARRRPCDP